MKSSMTPSASSRGRYNATAVMLVDVPNMDDDDVLMTSSCSSSRGSGSLEGGGGGVGQEKKTKQKKNKKTSDDRIKYIEYKDIDNAVIGIEHDSDEIRTFASSTSSSSASRRNRNLRNCRSGEGDGETRSTRLQQIHQQQQEQEQQSRRYYDDDDDECDNNFGNRRQLQNGQQLRPQQIVAGEEDKDDEEDDRPIARMRKGDIIPESVGTSTNSGNGISRNSAIFEILWGQSGMFHEDKVINAVNKFEDQEEEEENNEYYSSASIRISGMKNDQFDTKIHHRCQKLFCYRCCPIRLPLTSYLNDEHGITKPIKVLSCIFVCFVVVTSVGVMIALMVSYHMHQKDVPTLENSGGVGGGGVSGASYTLSAVEMASMSNADRLILAEKIDHICDKLHSTNIVNNEWSSDGSTGGECWSFCHEKRCCFTEDGTRRRRRLSDPMSRQRLRRQGHNDDMYEQKENHEFRRLQLAHSTIPGENDFTYVAHKANGSNTQTTEEVSSEEEKEENCGNDPNEFCLVFAGCAPLFGK